METWCYYGIWKFNQRWSTSFGASSVNVFQHVKGFKIKVLVVLPFVLTAIPTTYENDCHVFFGCDQVMMSIWKSTGLWNLISAKVELINRWFNFKERLAFNLLKFLSLDHKCKFTVILWCIWCSSTMNGNTQESPNQDQSNVKQLKLKLQECQHLILVF